MIGSARDRAKAPVVVGVDGSEPSLAAVRWSASEAASRSVPLRIIHGIPAETMASPLNSRSTYETDKGADLLGRTILREAVAAAESVAPKGSVSASLTHTSGMAAVLTAARPACLVAIGTPVRGPMNGMPFGSTGGEVLAHARCPVVLVPATAPTIGGDSGLPVALGMDLGAAEAPRGSDETAEFAFEFADRWDADLWAIRVLSKYDRVPPRWTETAPEIQPEIEPEKRLRDQLARWREKFPAVRLVTENVAGRPANVLAEASALAGLLVLGARGRGGVPGLVVGPVCRAVVRASRCPVAVVRT